MSNRIVNATNPTRPLTDAIKLAKTVGIAGLLAVAIAPNMAGASQLSHYRHYQAMVPESSWAADHGPGYSSRYARVSMPSQVAPSFVRGPWLTEINGAGP